MRVAVSLAKLDAGIAPDGQSGNRPGNSLREIFLLWLWHTNASVEQRIEALSDVLDAAPEGGWKLIKELLPSGMTSVSHNTHMPRWRSWADGWSRAKLQSEMATYAAALADLIVTRAADDAARWAQVVDGMLRFSPEITERVLSKLESMAAIADRDSETVFSLWTILRGVASRHEHYSDAQWAFNKETRTRIAAIRDALQPTDPVRRNYWLFDYHAELADVDAAEDFMRLREGVAKSATMLCARSSPIAALRAFFACWIACRT